MHEWFYITFNHKKMRQKKIRKKGSGEFLVQSKARREKNEANQMSTFDQR